MAPGSTQELAKIATEPVDTIDDVVERLEQIRAHAAATALRGEQDGIAAFTLLYRIITQNVGRTVDTGGFQDPAFLTELDLQFAITARACGASTSHSASVMSEGYRGARAAHPQPATGHVAFLAEAG